jgi:uracil DNA glycosylase
VLIGSQARSFKEFIKGSNYILEYPHPTETDGDWNESVFNDINNLIEKSNGKEFCIEW